MPDVILDSGFNWSPIQTGLEEMRAFANRTTSSIGRDIKGMFAGTIAVGAIVGGLREIVQEAESIHRESERFRIDAGQLQTIGNAAKELDIPLGTVARAMNLLELNSYKAVQGTQAQADALTALGIDIQQFYALRADQKILALADAYTRASDKAAAYANIATLVGKRNTELIPLIQQGSAAIKERGETMAQYTDQQVEEIHQAYVAWVQLGMALKVLGAEFTIAVVTPILKGIASINAAFGAMWAGIKEMAKGNVLIGAQQFLTGETPYTQEKKRVEAMINQPPPELRKELALEAPGGGLAEGGPGPGGPSADQVTLAEKLAKIQRDTSLAQLSDGGKLEALQRELYGLQTKELTQQGGTTEQMQSQVEIAQKQKDIQALQAKMSEDQASYDEQQAKLREQMNQQANQELSDSQEQTREIALQAMGRQDLAQRARIEYEYNQKIHDAQNAVVEAQKQGFDDVVATNQALVTQLTLEKNAALAAHDKAAAEEMAAKAAQEKSNVDAEKENLATLQEEAQMQALKNAGMQEAARELQIQLQYNKQINQAVAEANDLWTKSADAYAKGNKALGDQYAEHAKIKQAEADELALLKQQVLLAEQMRALEQAQKDTITAGIQLDQARGSIDSQTAQYEQQSVDLQYKSQDLATRINDAYESGNVLLAKQLEIEKGITDQQTEQAQNAAYANQLRTQGVIPGSVGTDALGRMAAAGLSFGQFDWASPQQQLLLKARAQLESVTGKAQFGWEERAWMNQQEAAWAKKQSDLATAAADKSRQQQIDYWTAVAAGKQPSAMNPFAATYGLPNFMTGGFSPLSPADQKANLMAQLLGDMKTNGMSQTQLLQIIATNTTLVRL